MRPRDTADRLSPERWAAAMTAPQFIARAVKYADFWQSAYRVARVPNEYAELAARAGGPWYWLVLAEDWCGEAVTPVALLARLAELAPGIELRIVRRDEHDDLMRAHLTKGARAIPVVICYDAAFQERGWWGPRPAELQRWFEGEGRALESAARYRHIRTWHARDRGHSVLREVLALSGVQVPAVASSETPSPR